MFQSPCGDLVSGKARDFFVLKVIGFAFQSPCGDLVSGKSLIIVVVKLFYKVSVPLRGFS